MRNRWWTAPVAAAAVALFAAACGSTASSSNGSGGSGGGNSGGGTAASPGSASGIKTASVNGKTVLVTASGRTIYWFAIDTPTKSNCTSSACVTYWPPLIGKASTASGVSLSGSFGTVKRPNGQLQATYMGHPLYLYKGDTAPGQVHGNDINISGGLWWAMTSTGAKLTSAKPGSGSSSSSSGGGGGNGY